MLKKIELNNYTTFIKPTIIDFRATNYKFLESENVGPNRILKGALFVGENASGKTQILKSISFLLQLVLSNSDVDFGMYKSFYTDKMTYTLKYDFLIDDSDISYEIEVGMDKIIKEILIVNKKNVINRNSKKASFNYNEVKEYDDLSDNLLFLRRIYFDTHFYEDKVLNDWFDFLRNSIYINCHTRQVFTSGINQTVETEKYLDKYDVKPINDFFKAINYGQKIVYSDSIVNEVKSFQCSFSDKKKFVSFAKDGTNIYVPDRLESIGNYTLIHLLPAFFHAIENNGLLIVDEFSSGFHNELEECLIKYFFHYAKNSKIFVVSHSTNLLNNTIFRPDQIYTTSFDAKKGTIVRRFSDEAPREAQNIEKMYLGGVFGDVPRYNKIFKD